MARRSINSTSKKERIKTLNRTTLEVAKDIIDNVKTDSKEARVAFISVWVCANDGFKLIADMVEDPNTDEVTRQKIMSFYKTVPTAFNTPLFIRVPESLQKTNNLSERAEEARKNIGAPGPVVVKGYNDPESLDLWKNNEDDNKE